MDLGLVLGIVGVIGIPLSVGLTMAVSTPGEFRFVKGLFGISAIVATAAIFLLQWESTTP